MQTLVRTATEEDVAAILPLWRELMEFHSSLDSQYRLVADAATQVETHLHAELATPTSILAVAECGSTIVAYCRASVRQQSPIFEQHSHGFISEFHVSPSFRRRGIGRSLFEHVQQWLVEQDIRRVELVTLSANEASTAFWQSVGCLPYAERRFLTLPGA